MTNKQRIHLLATARAKAAELNKRRDLVYDQLNKKLGIKDDHSWVFDYIFNGMHTARQIAKIIEAKE